MNAAFDRTSACSKRRSALVHRTVKWNSRSSSETASFTPSIASSEKMSSDGVNRMVAFSAIATDALDDSSLQTTGDVGRARSLTIMVLRASQLVRFGRQNTDCSPGRPLRLVTTAGGPSHSVLFPEMTASSGTFEQSAVNHPLSQLQASTFASHWPWPEHAFAFKEQLDVCLEGGIVGACETASTLGIVAETGSRGACE